jgi:hypothetical protein
VEILTVDELATIYKISRVSVYKHWKNLGGFKLFGSIRFNAQKTHDVIYGNNGVSFARYPYKTPEEKRQRANKNRKNDYEQVWKNGKKHRVHRLIAEGILGRLLKRNEVVHHINGDNKDNRNGNLLICDTKYHHWLHWGRFMV